MPSVPDEFLAEVNARTDISDLISNYVQLKPRGNRMVGLCPFHNEKTGSFTVFLDTNSYYCFGCGAGGGPVTFVRQIENLDFFESVKLLADRAGLQMPDSGYDDSFAKLKRRLYEINRETARFFHNYLMSEGGKPILNYFLSRGLSMATIKKFGLGASPNEWDALIRHLRSKGFREDEMLTANVVMRGQKGGFYDRFRNRAMFPIIDLRGNVIAFGGRALPGEDKKGAKYINTSDTPIFKKSQNLYALNIAKSNCQKRIILAEGYMDVIALHQAGVTNAVAALGTAFTDEHASLLSRYTSEIVLTLDSDAAGKQATERAIKILSKTGMPVRVLTIPDGKDPDEFIKKHGKNAANAFRDLLEGSMNSIEYKIIDAAAGLDTSTDSGRLEYLKRCATLLGELNDTIAIDLYAGRLSEKFKISKSAILSQVKQRAKQINRREGQKKLNEIIKPKINTHDVNPQRQKNLRAATAEEKIISILMYSPDLLPTVEEKITPKNFITEFNRRVYERLLEVIHGEQIFNVSLLSSDFTPAECGRVAEYQNSIVKATNAKQELRDCINVLLQENINQSTAEKDISIDEWAENIKRIANNKK